MGIVGLSLQFKERRWLLGLRWGKAGGIKQDFGNMKMGR